MVGLVGALLPSTAVATAGINQQINFQGRLLNSAGAVVADGNYNMRFKIYCDGDGVLGGVDPGSCTAHATNEHLLWTETRQNSAGAGVAVKNGYFSVELGSVATLSGVDFNQSTLWLSMEITTNGTDTSGSPTYNGEMTPYKRLASAVYAMNAGQLGGFSAASYARLAAAQSFTSTNTFSNNGTGVVLSGTPATGASILQVGSALTSGSTNGTLIGGSTASSADLINLQVSGASKIKVTTTGATTLADTLTVQAGGASITGALTVAGVSSLTGLAAGSTTALQVSTGATSNIGVYIQATSGQTADLLRVKDGAGNDQLKIAATGSLSANYKPTANGSDGSILLGATATQSSNDINGVLGFWGTGVKHAQIAYAVGDGFYLCDSSAGSPGGDYGQCSTRVNLYANTGDFSSSLNAPVVNANSSNLTLQTTTSGNVVINGAGILDVQDNTTHTGTTAFNGQATFNTDLDAVLSGAENLAVTTDLAGSVDALSVVATPSASAGTTRGLLVQQANSANTNGLDNALVVNNADTDLAIGAALQVTNSGGGGYTNLLDTPSLDISGAGAITGATGVTSSGTITFSGLTNNGPVYTTAGGVLNSEVNLSVARGGTGLGSTTAYGLLAGGTTSTGVLQNVGTGSSGNILKSNGNAALPTWVANTSANICSDCLVQVPALGQNTITPTVASVVGLTVNATSGTAATAAIINQTQAATGVAINLSNASGTAAAGLAVAKTAAGAATSAIDISNATGTTTNAININNNASGTMTNGISFGGTIGTDISRASGTLSMQGASTSIQTAAAGTISLGTTNNSAITTGTGTLSQGGNISFSGSTARSITGPGTGGLTVGVTSGPLTLSTTTSGTLAVTSAGALNLTGAAASTMNYGANTLAVTSSKFNLTSGGALSSLTSLNVSGNINGTSYTGGGLTDCNAQNSKVLWDSATSQFSCGTDRASFYAVKASNENRVATTTLADDATFKFTVGVSETWAFQIFTYFLSPSTTPDLKISMLAPTGSTCDMGLSNTYNFSNYHLTACNTASSGIEMSGDPFDQETLIWGQVTVGASLPTSTVGLRWAQNTASGTTTEIAGGYMIAYKLSGADVAEAYNTNDATIQPGDVVSVDGGLQNGVKKSSGAYDGHALGVISTKPGQILSDGPMLGRQALVALVGRIPVKVTTENGAIKAGDYLTASSIPGMAMKATRPGQVIGKALADFDGAQTRGQGMVMMFADLSYYAGDAMNGAAGAALTNADGADGSPAATATVNDLTQSVNGLQGTQKQQQDLVGDLQNRVTALENAMARQPPGQALEVLNTKQATVANDLTVGGVAKVGRLTLADTALEVDDEPLKLQPSGRQGVEIVGGKVVIDTAGNLAVKGAVTAAKLNISTDDAASASIGEAHIVAGQTRVEVPTTAVTTKSKVFVTATTKSGQALSVTQRTAGKSFVVELEDAKDKDIYFDWWIVN